MADSGASVVYFAVSNIPAAFRSADLRNYFSQFIESDGFLCFHYRHRPETIREPRAEPEATERPGGGSATEPETDRGTETGTEPGKQQVKSCCCVVSVRAAEAERLVRLYAGQHWIDSKGGWLARRCVLRRVRVSSDNGEWTSSAVWGLDGRKHYCSPSGPGSPAGHSCFVLVSHQKVLGSTGSVDEPLSS